MTDNQFPVRTGASQTPEARPGGRHELNCIPGYWRPSTHRRNSSFAGSDDDGLFCPCWCHDAIRPLTPRHLFVLRRVEHDGDPFNEGWNAALDAVEKEVGF